MCDNTVYDSGVVSLLLSARVLYKHLGIPLQLPPMFFKLWTYKIYS